MAITLHGAIGKTDGVTPLACRRDFPIMPGQRPQRKVLCFCKGHYFAGSGRLDGLRNAFGGELDHSNNGRNWKTNYFNNAMDIGLIM